jgi:hypothetical protein
MNAVEFDLASLSQELRLLATTRRASRETWVHTTLPSVARASTLCMILGESGEEGTDVELALRTLLEALAALSPPRADEDAAAQPHSSDGPWSQVVTAAAQTRAAFAGKVPEWILPH